MRHRAIINTHANVTTINAETDAYDKDGNVVTLDESKITTEIARLQAEYESKKYQRDRVYPSIGEQLDLQYWDKVNGTSKWQEAVSKVKSAHPKPTE